MSILLISPARVSINPPAARCCTPRTTEMLTALSWAALHEHITSPRAGAASACAGPKRCRIAKAQQGVVQDVKHQQRLGAEPQSKPMPPATAGILFDGDEGWLSEEAFPV